EGGGGLPGVAPSPRGSAARPLCPLSPQPLQRRLDRHAAVMAVSQPVIEAHSRYFDAEWEIVPNGVDPEFFPPATRRPAGSESAHLLFLGRLDPRNGLDTVLAAMP